MRNFLRDIIKHNKINIKKNIYFWIKSEDFKWCTYCITNSQTKNEKQSLNNVYLLTRVTYCSLFGNYHQLETPDAEISYALWCLCHHCTYAQKIKSASKVKRSVKKSDPLYLSFCEDTVHDQCCQFRDFRAKCGVNCGKVFYKFGLKFF